MRKLLLLFAICSICTIGVYGCSNKPTDSISEESDIFDDIEEYEESSTEATTEFEETEDDYDYNDYTTEYQKDIGDLYIESTLPEIPTTEEETTAEETTEEYVLETVSPTTVAETTSSSDQFVDKNTGDIDNSNFEMTADMIFLSNVDLLIADFPLNQLDRIVAEISEPIIKKYGRGDYVCSMYNYTKNDDGSTTFTVEAKETGWTVIIKPDAGGTYRVNIEEAPFNKDN